MSQLVCPKCGCEVGLVRMRAEESLVRLSDDKVLAANRWFEGECPQCGSVLSNKVGHHSTVQTKRLKELFPKAKLRLLRSQLTADEFRRLKAAREGKQSLTGEELKRLVKIAQRIK